MAIDFFVGRSAAEASNAKLAVISAKAIAGALDIESPPKPPLIRRDRCKRLGMKFYKIVRRRHLPINAACQRPARVSYISTADDNDFGIIRDSARGADDMFEPGTIDRPLSAPPPTRYPRTG
jgi:hypothetical protein